MRQVGDFDLGGDTVGMLRDAFERQVEEAVRAGITQIVIITGRNKSALEDHFDRSPELESALERSGKHEALACVKCHTTVSDESVPYAQRVADFGGLHAECVACHADKDPHKGQFGRACGIGEGGGSLGPFALRGECEARGQRCGKDAN